MTDLTLFSMALTSDDLLVILTAVLVVVTGVYAYLTRSIVLETVRMRKAQTDPFVSVISEPSEQWVNLIDMMIKNIGLGPAYDIKFQVTPDFQYARGKFLSNVPVIKNGIPYLAPDQQIRFLLTEILEDYQEKIRSPFNITVTYKNFNKEPQEATFIIDLSVWDELAVGPSDIHQIAESVKKIANGMKD